MKCIKNIFTTIGTYITMFMESEVHELFWEEVGVI